VKRFSFNLEKVLELRKYRERETAIELGRALGALRELEIRLEETAVRLSRAAAEQFGPDHTLETIQNYHRFILRLESDRERLLGEAAGAEVRAEEARGVYLEASRDRKVLDKLKEARRREHRREAFAVEAKALDDISGGRQRRP
jgi:flagellar FliJ protein